MRQCLYVMAVLVTSAVFRAGVTTVSGVEHPNVIFIMADDLGWADVGFHTSGAEPRAITPNLDELAASSLELTQHYVAPVCSPTRTGLMSGRCWSRFGVTRPQNEQAMPNETLTLPRALKEVGYATCLTGKWHLGSLPTQGPNHFGFDHSYGSLAGGVSPWNHHYKRGPFTHTWHRNESLIHETGHVTDLITDEAVQYIERSGDRPYFLYVPFTAVHLPLKEPQEWLDRVPAWITGDVPRHYAASLLHLDDSIRRIRDAVARREQTDNTLLVFTSDNGGSTAENNDLNYPDDDCPSGRLSGNNLPLRGQKGDLYEGGTRVPTLVSWPRRIKAGHNATPVQIIDWMPTLCALTGFQAPASQRWDGIDLTPMLLQGTKLAPRDLYAVAPGWQARSLRHENWKLIVFAGDQPHTELYDLARDPNELRNIAYQFPDRVDELERRLSQAAAADLQVARE